MDKKPEILNKELIGKGNWLTLSKLEYNDRSGRVRHWEAAERVNSRGAVLMIARICQTDELILIKQFRPPAGKYLIEFPAGLIDPGESPEHTAERELLEETGYHGKIVSVSPPGYSSPGMSGETIVTVKMEINGDHFEDAPPESRQEDSEDIETILVKRCELMEFIRDAANKGYGVDSKVIAYAEGIELNNL
jgi:8-oxo-dGTP pyrophosphatase MutT (NUDIX family)